MLRQDHHSTALAICRTTTSGGPDFLGTLAPVNITDRRTVCDGPISLAIRGHNGVVVSVKASFSGPNTLANSASNAAGLKHTNNALLLLLFSHRFHFLDALVCQQLMWTMQSVGQGTYLLMQLRDGSQRSQLAKFDEGS